LLRQVAQWHLALGGENPKDHLIWASSGIRPFELEEGDPETDGHKVWTIRELLTSVDLFMEGRQQHHCVGTYAKACKAGKSSIWTMDTRRKSGMKKCITIEVEPRRRRICQARGQANRLPSQKERGMLARWASQAGLKLAGHV
ncbi:MAG: PcfJ domain-containing protein, partial [Verrucomicrobiota bacterium]